MASPALRRLLQRRDRRHPSRQAGSRHHTSSGPDPSGPATRASDRAPARVVVAVLAVVLAVVASVGGTAGTDPASASTCWAPPVDAPVIDPYRPPACPWCPGNRGLEYGTGPGTPVRAVASGTVSFSGRVVHTGYVVVRHRDGIRATYGGLREPFRPVGSFVPVGAIVGTTEQPLHFGLRDGDQHVDPTPLIGTLVMQPRLVPLDDSPRRPGAVRLRCGREGGGGRPLGR